MPENHLFQLFPDEFLPRKQVPTVERSEIDTLLNGRPLQTVLDIKTLVLDQIREMPPDQLTAIFWEKLPSLSYAKVQEYLFMNRD